MDRLKTSPLSNDHDLIIAIREGGNEGDQAIMMLYARHRADIQSFLEKLCSKYKGGKCDPEDIMHDSFIVMLHKIRSDGPPIPSVINFWMGIARKLWVNQVRKNGKIFLVKDNAMLYGTQEETPESIYLKTELYQQIDGCLHRCGGRCREVLLMWLNKYSMEDIATRMHLSSPAIARKIKHECFKKIKEMLEKGNEI